jgi:hypothetical protein
MRFASSSLVLLLGVACSTACSSGSGTAATAGDGGSGTSPDGGEGPFVPVAPWKATSARVELASSDFFLGSMKYTKDRGAMSPAQLQALAGLRTRPENAGPRPQDVQTYALTIVDADGSRASYVAADENFTPKQSGDVAGTVDKPTLDPFLATLTCLKAKSVSACSAAPGEPTPAACKAVLRDDPACLNGVFMPGTCADVSMSLEVSHAGPYEIATSECFESVTIKLLGADGTTVLETSSAGTKPSCAALTHTFDAAGTYRIVLEKRNTAGCGASGNAGDMYLRVTPR